MDNDQQENKSLPAETVTLQIEKNRYVVKFPTNGQFRAIQNLKNNLAGGADQYNQLSYSSDPDDYASYQFINVEAYFTVLIPQLIKDLNLRSLQDLDILTMQKLVHEVYEEQFLPWYNEWTSVINKVSNDYYKRKEEEAKSRA